MAHTKRGRKLIQSDDGRISSAIFEAANVLLAKARYFRKPFLRQAISAPNSPHVPANEFPHVHAGRSSDYTI